MMRLQERSAFLGSIRLVSASNGGCAAGCKPCMAMGPRMAQPRTSVRAEPRPVEGAGAGNLRGVATDLSACLGISQKHSMLDRRF